MKKIYVLFFALQILSFSAYAYLNYSPSALNFQAQPGGITTSLTFTATNPSNSTTTWSVYPNVIDGNYAWVQSITPTDAYLKPGESQVFTVKVTYPHNAGTYSYTPKFTLEGYIGQTYVTNIEAAPAITLVSTGPPASPTNQTVSCLKTTFAILNWTPSATTGVTGYKITLQGTSTNTYYTTSNSYTLYDLNSGTKYNFKVDAYVTDESYISNSSYSTFTTLTGNELGAIQGPNELCLNSQATYSCNNISGATYYWNTPGFSGSSSTNSINLINQTAGLNTISVYYVSGCYTSPSITYTIQVSPSKPNNISICSISNLGINPPDVGGFKILPSGGFYAYEGTLSLCDGAGLATQYQWSSINGAPGNLTSWWGNGGSVDVATKSSMGSITLLFTESNACGSTSQAYQFTAPGMDVQRARIEPVATDNDLRINDNLLDTIIGKENKASIRNTGTFDLLPNPATDIVQVTINHNLGSNTFLVSENIDQNSLINYSVYIYNSLGALVYSTIKVESSFSIPVNNLKEGVYFVVINSDKESFKQKLIVKH